MSNHNNINAENNDEIDKIVVDEKVNMTNLIESRRQVIKNNYWNEEHDETLLSLQKSSNRLSKEYQKAYLKYRTKLQLYRIPIIIISALGGFLSLSNTGYIPLDYNKWISLFVGFSNLLVTIISLIENFKKIDSNTNSAYSAHINFQRLHDEITIIRRMPPEEREENGHTTVFKLFTRYETFLSDAPILNKILRDYLEGASDTNEKTGTIILKNDGSNLNDSSSENEYKYLELDEIESQIIKINKKLNDKYKIKKTIINNDIINKKIDINDNNPYEIEFLNLNKFSKNKSDAYNSSDDIFDHDNTKN